MNTLHFMYLKLLYNVCKHEKIVYNMRNCRQKIENCLQISYLAGISNSSIPGFLQDWKPQNLCVLTWGLGVESRFKALANMYAKNAVFTSP